MSQKTVVFQDFRTGLTANTGRSKRQVLSRMRFTTERQSIPMNHRSGQHLISSILPEAAV
jgi:hypothetical protein